MIEFELVVREVQKLYEKERSLRGKMHLENALKSLSEYDKMEALKQKSV